MQHLNIQNIFMLKIIHLKKKIFFIIFYCSQVSTSDFQVSTTGVSRQNVEFTAQKCRHLIFRCQHLRSVAKTLSLLFKSVDTQRQQPECHFIFYSQVSTPDFQVSTHGVNSKNAEFTVQKCRTHAVSSEFFFI